MRERLSTPVNMARNALWSARVSLADRAEALLLPFYTFARRRRKRKK
jgi:hypothetical protein